VQHYGVPLVPKYGSAIVLFRSGIETLSRLQMEQIVFRTAAWAHTRTAPHVAPHVAITRPPLSNDTDRLPRSNSGK